MHVLEFAVRPSELDSFGHVNNARYLEYLEWARSEWSIENGVSYDKFRDLFVIPAVVEARMRFMSESRLGDTLRIETVPELVHSARLLFRQDIRNQDNRRVLKAEISVVAVDTRTRTITEFPEMFLKALRPAAEKP